MKNKTKTLATLLAFTATVIGAFLPAKVFAATNVVFQDDITTIPITREVENVSNPVTNTFTYTITAQTGNPDGATGVPNSATIQFNAVTPTSGHKATAVGAIDFASTSFTKPGDYFFTVSETSSSSSSIYPVDATEYTAIASVRFGANTDTLVVTLLQEVKNNDGDKVSATWSSESPRTYFEISNSTTGNMADLGLCFDYVINIPTGNGIVAGDKFAVSTASPCAGNPEEITAGDNSTISLKNGDTVTIGLLNNINQLPIGSGYSITLNDAHGYTATFNEDSMSAGVAKVVSGLVAVNDPNFNSNNKAAIVLRKDADVYTGIANNIWTYIIILAIGATGVAIAINQVRHRK